MRKCNICTASCNPPRDSLKLRCDFHCPAYKPFQSRFNIKLLISKVTMADSNRPVVGLFSKYM